MRFRGLRADTFVTGSTNGSLLSKFGALHFARLTKSESIIECTVFGKCWINNSPRSRLTSPKSRRESRKYLGVTQDLTTNSPRRNKDNPRLIEIRVSDGRDKSSERNVLDRKSGEKQKINSRLSTQRCLRVFESNKKRGARFVDVRREKKGSRRKSVVVASVKLILSGKWNRRLANWKNVKIGVATVGLLHKGALFCCLETRSYTFLQHRHESAFYEAGYHCLQWATSD